jgi:hypothetical protein
MYLCLIWYPDERTFVVARLDWLENSDTGVQDMFRTLGKLLASAVLLASAGAAQAQLTNKVGTVQALYADPSDVVIQLDVPGPCGSVFYHIKRTSVNFNQVFELARTAIAVNKKLSVFVTPNCQGDRNILSHAAIYR